MTIILQILENLVHVVFLGIGFYLVEKAKPDLRNWIYLTLHGISFGLIAFLVTSTPVSLGDGATVDARAGPVLLAGVIAGPIAGTIAALLGGLARGLVGGSFAFSGVLVYAVYAFLGVAFWFYRGKRMLVSIRPKLVAATCLASCFGASGMYFFIHPQERAVAWLQKDLPFIMVANTLSILFATLAMCVALGILAKSREAQDAHETLRLAKRAGGFGIWDYDVKTGKVNWDERSQELHGFSNTNGPKNYNDWTQRVHPDDLDKTVDAFRLSLKSKDTFDSEYRVIHADKSEHIIKGDGVVLRDEKGDATRVVGTNLDLTNIRATEAKLQEAQLVAVHAQKFETIGQLTGGVAHDFNNLLAVIMGNLELIGDENKNETINHEEIDVLLNASIEATRRGADLTQNMLAYARKARLSPVILDINHVVRETENWMRRTIPSRIGINTNLEPDLGLIRADKSSFQSALVNLLLNARDAFEGSGCITIGTKNLELDAGQLKNLQLELASGKFVTLTIKDDGAGIDTSILGSVFDPFFTTKRVGEGSGLGLSMVQGFVKQTGGAIRVRSQTGVGTVFSMYFPTVESEGDPGVSSEWKEQRSVPVASPSNRILLVEDHLDVLVVLRKTLESAGYEVATASSGDEAFAVFCNAPGFDLVVTDIVMPGALQGHSLAAEIRSLQPEMDFIFLSGYSSQSMVDGKGVKESDARLMKPVSRSALLSAVEHCLRARETASLD